MSIKPAASLCLWLCLLGVTALRAQTIFVGGALPAINLNVGLPGKWSVNLKGESRHLLMLAERSFGLETGYAYVLTDASVMFSRKTGLNNALAAGYLMRFREGLLIHRAIQQFTLVGLGRKVRLAHRFRTDQTFAPGEAGEFRFRYRLTAEIALDGDNVDTGEWYFKVNNEYLNAFQGKDYNLELRLVPLFGYAFSDRNKLELGLDYRVSSFLEGRYLGVLWASVCWYVKLN